MYAIKFAAARDGKQKCLRRAALCGFWFFFVKGLLWLAAPLVFYYFV